MTEKKAEPLENTGLSRGSAWCARRDSNARPSESECQQTRFLWISIAPESVVNQGFSLVVLSGRIHFYGCVVNKIVNKKGSMASVGDANASPSTTSETNRGTASGNRVSYKF